MRFPKPEEEQELHDRLTRGDPLATVDLWTAMMDPLISAVRQDLRCDEDLARYAAIEAMATYLGQPDCYRPGQARLCTYLIQIAKNKARDRHRSRHREQEREPAYAEAVAIRAVNPRDAMEQQAETKEVMERLKRVIVGDRDQRALGLMLKGERNVGVLAEALGHGDRPPEEQAELVRKARNRLMKAVQRLGEEMRDEDP